jgi:hypothetical protein
MNKREKLTYVVYKKTFGSQAPGAHACNPDYLGG